MTVAERYVYASQPGRDRVLVISVEQMVVVDVSTEMVVVDVSPRHLRRVDGAQ